VGVLRIENAIATLQLSRAHESCFALELAMLAVFVASVALFRWYLASLESHPAALRQRPGERGATADPAAPDSLTL